MNNDFNYRPAQPKPSAQAAGSKESAAESEPQEQPAAPAPQVITSDRRGGGFRKFLSYLVLLVLLAAAAGGVYYWQQSQVKNLQASQSSLQGQVSALQSQLAKKNSAPATTATPPVDITDVITVSPANVTASGAAASAQYSSSVTQVWIESGAAPDKLTTISQKFTPVKGATDAVVALTGLKPATEYYYRAAGTVNGKTVYGGIIAFTTTK